MSELTTFFRHRRNDPGATDHNKWKTEKMSKEFSVYCRKAMRSRFFKPEEPPKELSVYEESVKSRGGGIVVAMSTVDGISKTIEIRGVPSGDYQLPKQFLMLQPGRPPYFCELDGSNQVSAASHLIIPVDTEAEHHLKSFYDQLPWFSPDFEALVLHAIRKPSIDSRLDDLETHVYGQTTGEWQKEAARGRWERVRLGFKKTLLDATTYALLAVGVIIVLLGIDVFRLNELKETIKAQRPAETSTMNPGAQHAARVRESEAAKSTKKLKDATQQFLTELDKRKGSNKKLKELYDNYFQNFRSDAKDIDKWYAPDRQDDQRFLSGLIEVQRLKDGSKDPDVMSRRFTNTIQCRLDKCTDDNADITAGLRSLTDYLNALK